MIAEGGRADLAWLRMRFPFMAAAPAAVQVAHAPCPRIAARYAGRRLGHCNRDISGNCPRRGPSSRSRYLRFFAEAFRIADPVRILKPPLASCGSDARVKKARKQFHARQRRGKRFPEREHQSEGHGCREVGLQNLVRTKPHDPGRGFSPGLFSLERPDGPGRPVGPLKRVSALVRVTRQD